MLDKAFTAVTNSQPAHFRILPSLETDNALLDRWSIIADSPMILPKRLFYQECGIAPQHAVSNTSAAGARRFVKDPLATWHQEHLRFGRLLDLLEKEVGYFTAAGSQTTS